MQFQGDDGCRTVLAESGTELVEQEAVRFVGDRKPGLQLVQIAAASGATAGVGAAQSFFGKQGAPTSPPPAPDPTTRARAGGPLDRG